MVADMVLAGLSQGSQATYLHSVDTFVRRTWIAPGEAKENDLEQYLRDLSQGGVARGTFNLARHALQFLFQNTLRRKWPLFKKKIRAPRQKRIPEALSDAECRRLLTAVQQPVYRACFTVMYGCGLRIGEAMTLTPRQIDKDRHVIRVVGKGNKERLVPLAHSLLESLRKAWVTHRNPVWVFANQAVGDHVPRKTLYLAFHHARQEAQLSEVTPHVFRHSYATRLLEKGVQVQVVQILLGHSSPRTTQTYLHLTEPSRAQIRTVVGELMQDLC